MCAGKPFRRVVARQGERRFALAAQAVEQARVVDRVDVPLQQRGVMQRHVVVPQRHIARHVQVIVAEPRLQHMRLQLVEQRPRLLARHPVDLDRRPHTRPRSPDRAVQRLDPGARVGAHQRRQPARVAFVEPAPYPGALQQRLPLRRQRRERRGGVRVRGLAIQWERLAQPDQLRVGALEVGARIRLAGEIRGAPPRCRPAQRAAPACGGRETSIRRSAAVRTRCRYARSRPCRW